MKQLSNNEMKKVLGGVLPPPPPPPPNQPESICSVQCGNGDWKTRDCGSGSTCSCSGTVIACNSETTGQQMCITLS